MQTAQFVSRLNSLRYSFTPLELCPRRVRRTSGNPHHVAMSIDKQLLEKLLNSKSNRLDIRANDKGKNLLIWSQFDIAYVDGIEQKYACCKFCNGFIRYTGRTGTGGLMRHFCYKKFKSETDAAEGNASADDEGESTASARLRIKALVLQNSPRINYVSNLKGKSDVWSQFKMITVDDVPTNFACCITCRSLVTYMSKTGTGSMTRHKCKLKNYVKSLEYHEEETQSESTSLLIKSEETLDFDKKECDKHESENEMTPLECSDKEETEVEKDGISTEMEKLLREKHFRVLNKSLRLFDIFENEEFLDLAQFLVCLGAKYGPIDVKKIFKKKINLIRLNQS